MQLLLIGGFGVAGVLLRFLIASTLNPAQPGTFPWGTFLINIAGALAAGVVFTLGAEKAALSPELRTGILVGFLGGFTTFSAFCLESAQLLQAGQLTQAALYLALSNALGVAAAAAGIALARKSLKTLTEPPASSGTSHLCVV